MYKFLTMVACVQFLTAAVSATPAPHSVRTYAQQIVVEYATADDASKAVLEFAPVYDARDWAFSARWDDCNPNSLQMRQHMAKFGLKGTFYLTANNKKNSFGPDFCKQLMEGGFSIGGHTMTHPKLPELKAGAIWWEIAANRIAREDDTEMPLNSMAFSYGAYRSNTRPEAFPMISEAVRRAGYHHCVYFDFVRDNPHLAPNEISSGCQVAPGDRVVNADAFQKQLEKPLKWPEQYKKHSCCIFLGVHPWQQGEEWNKLDEVFKTISGKPDWWYCNQTEWAAYTRQAKLSTLRSDAVSAGATRRCYEIARPKGCELGADIPLTCVIGNAKVKSVKLDGKDIPFQERGAKTVVNLPHTPEETIPARIGHIEMPATAKSWADALECSEFPGVKALLVADQAGQKVKLMLSAPASTPLRDVCIRFRLPLQYEPGVVTQTLEYIRAGSPASIEIDLPKPKPESFWSEGPQYWVTEIDFATSVGRGRLHVTRLIPE